MRKAALVTGGAKRIGRAIALFLAGRGYDIALHYNTSEREAEDTARSVRAHGVECRLFRADLSDKRQVRQLMPKVVKKFPTLRLLVNNAAVFRKATLPETDDRLFDCEFDVNFRAPALLTRDFGKFARRGTVINILDTKIAEDKVGYFAYTLSKKALAEYTRMAGNAMAPLVKVYGIAPGLILPPEGKAAGYLRGISEKTGRPLGSLIEVTSIVGRVIDGDFKPGEIVFT